MSLKTKPAQQCKDRKQDGASNNQLKSNLQKKFCGKLDTIPQQIDEKTQEGGEKKIDWLRSNLEKSFCRKTNSNPQQVIKNAQEGKEKKKDWLRSNLEGSFCRKTNTVQQQFGNESGQHFMMKVSTNVRLKIKMLLAIKCGFMRFYTFNV